jgi:two-component system LytT family response regulator
MTVLIIEDEMKAARELKRIIHEIDDTIKIIAILDSIETGKQWFEENESPDLIFSDIQLADGLCFDLFSQIEIKSPVIFCTAFDEYLMNAFDTNAISYLLKPVTKEKVERAVTKYSKLKEGFQKKQSIDYISDLLKGFKLPYKTTLLVHQKEKIIPVPVQDIAFFYLDTPMVSIVTLTHQKYYLSNNLDDIEKTVDPAIFYRANRQFIVNRKAISTAEKFFARKLVAQLSVKTPEQIIVSKAKAPDFLKWLEGDH